MTTTSGQDVVDSLGRRDLNQDGSVINLAIVGSSRFYDFEVFEKDEGFKINTESDNQLEFALKLLNG